MLVVFSDLSGAYHVVGGFSDLSGAYHVGGFSDLCGAYHVVVWSHLWLTAWPLHDPGMLQFCRERERGCVWVCVGVRMSG